MIGTNPIKISNRFSSVSISFIILTLSMIIFFTVFIFIPKYITIKKIREDKSIISSEIKITEEIIPSYTFTKKIKESNFQTFDSQNHNIKLPRNKLPEFANQLEKITNRYHLIFLSAQIDPNTMKTGLIEVDLDVKGSISKLRPFLISIISLPFFDAITHIKIDTENNDIQIYDISFKIRIDTKNE